MVSVDLVGRFTSTKWGTTTMLVILSQFTIWADAMALFNGTIEVVTDALEHKVFCYLAVPEQIHTDQGTQFE